MAAATDVERVRIYSPSDSRFACTNDLDDELDAPVEAVDSARDAVESANTVVTATPAESSVLDCDWLAPGALVVAVDAFSPEMQKLDSRTFDRANQVFADVPEEARETGDVIAADLMDGAVGPLAGVLEGTAGRGGEDEIVVVESVGSAVFNAATAASVVELAEADDVGTLIDL